MAIGGFWGICVSMMSMVIGPNDAHLRTSRKNEIWLYGQLRCLFLQHEHDAYISYVVHVYAGVSILKHAQLSKFLYLQSNDRRHVIQHVFIIISDHLCHRIDNKVHICEVKKPNANNDTILHLDIIR